MNTRIRWTAAERAAVVERATYVFHPEMRRLELMLKAHEHFDPSRRRTQFTSTELRELWVYCYEQRQLRRAASATAAKLEATTAPPPVPEPREDPKEGLGNLFERLVDAIADRVVQRLTRSPSPPGSTTPAFDPEEARRNLRERSQQSIVPATRPPGVLIIGLLEGQAQTISMEYMKRLSLSFRTTDAAKSHEVLNREYIVLMTKFISHSVQEKYRTALGTRLLCNGGLSELREILDRIVSPVV